MVDFNKRILNSNKFRGPAIQFIETGRYCTYPQGSSEYFKFWDQEKDRCVNGYTADDGDYITGYNYFYLNYCPISRITNKEVVRKDGTKYYKRVNEVSFPDFWDYDYYFFQAMHDAEDQGKHMCVLKARRRGYSYKGASMVCRNYYLIPNSKSFIYASNKQYLTEDGILTKAWDYMDFIDKNTAWGKKRSVNTQMRKRAGFFTRDEYGNEIELGYKSEIIGVTLKDNPSVVRGKKASLIIFEEAGSASELAAAWQIARPSVEIDGVAFAPMLCFGTGGDEDSRFATLKDMFYHPEGYNCISFPNIWDETATTNECGFFVPQYTNIDLRDDNGKRIYMDVDGNTLRKKSLEYILEERRKVIENATSNAAIDRYVAERPITPAEAMLEFNGNIFPKKELQEQLALLRTNTKLQNHKQVGDLIWEANGELKWVIKKTGDITHYPLRQGDDPTGSIVIWEHPNKEASPGLYIAGCLTPGEKVLTDKGYKAVEDVTFDDKLISKEGNYVDIRNLQRYYKEDETIYKVRVSHSYSTTTFTSEHPLYVADQNVKGDKGGDSYGRISAAKMDFSFKPMKEVKEGQWIKYPNVYHKTSNFDIDLLWDSENYRIDHRIDSPLKNKEFWWFVGLWLGDGYNIGDYNVSICFNSNEREYIDRFCKLQSLFKRSFSLRELPEKHTVQASMCFKQLNRFLFKHFGKYADGKRIPEWVKFMDPEFKKALLQGYLDSDGCVYNCGKYCITGFVSINLPLLEAFQDILFSLGIISNMSRLRDSKVHHFGSRECATKPCYQLRMAQHDSIKFKSFYTGYDHKLEKIKYAEIRKHPKDGCFFSDDLNYIYFKIREIEKSKYTGVVYNFECDTHTFLCRHITTHNCDSYDYDESTTTSLGSCFIYKRIQSIEAYSDIIVAEYTGRPKTAEEFYENVRKLLIYYNARCMYENQNKGIFAYFTNKHCDYLLADQPDIISDIIKDSKVNRKKGCHMNKQLKQWSWGLIKDWLNEINPDGKKNLYNIMSEPLLEELIAANDVVNVDRVSSLAQLMIYREELYNVKVKEIKKENRQRVLFDGPIFTQEWFRDDGTNNLEAYMF